MAALPEADACNGLRIPLLGFRAKCSGGGLGFRVPLLVSWDLGRGGEGGVAVCNSVSLLWFRTSY